jgi:putative ABC transport system substrate-binding protein
MVGLGLYQSIARPGGNITGIDSQSEVLDAKRIDFLKQLVPDLSRLALVYNSDDAGAKLHFQNMAAAVQGFGIAVRPVDLHPGTGVDAAFDAILHDRPDAILSILDTVTFFHRNEIVAFASANKFPMTNEAKEFVALGQLMSYGASLSAIFLRSAYYVDRLLKGAKAGELPIEQPTIFELAINLKTAKALGIAVPESLIAAADVVIE